MQPIRIHEQRVAGPLDPWECHLRLARGGPAVLLDGRRGQGPLERYAYVMFDPFDVVRFAAGSDRDRAREGRDPIAHLFQRLRAWGRLEGAPPGRMRGGAAGLLGYDLGRHLERLPATAALASQVPDLWCGLFHRGLEIDLADGNGTLFVADVAGTARSGAAYARRCLDQAAALLHGDRPQLPPAAGAAAPLRSNFTAAGYCAAVERVREAIRSGDVYQVNLAQRFAAPFAGDARALYAELRRINPAPFAALLELGACAVLSASPERFVRKEGDRVETRPIKGTRRRTGDSAADAAACAELMAAPKDAAELAMIVDLERNDLGKVCRFGEVRVESPGQLEEHPTVFHRVAVVSGILRAEVDGEDLLRAAFPGGSITGAPKIRAMQVIEELEGLRRGVFTGAIGWIGLQGDLDLNIAIRTLVVEPGIAHFHAGGGIVLDSDPWAEYQETLAKGEALARALQRSLI